MKNAELVDRFAAIVLRGQFEETTNVSLSDSRLNMIHRGEIGEYCYRIANDMVLARDATLAGNQEAYKGDN